MSFILSTVWSMLNLCNRRLYYWGLRKSTKIPARVISIGNLQAGGAGKTPICMKIASEAIEKHKLSVAVLLRGYKGELEKFGGVICPEDREVDPATFGDEACLIHKKVLGVWIGVGANRVKSYERLRKAKGSDFDLVLLDDGFQNFQLKKDLEVLLVTSSSRFERVFRDFYRESSFARLLLWTKGEVIPSWLKTRTLVEGNFEAEIPADRLGQPVVLATAVAEPHEVARMATRKGLKIAEQLTYPDHYSFSSEDAFQIVRIAEKRDLRVALTGKDWVKLKKWIPEQSILLLEPEFVLKKGIEIWEKELWDSFR